MSRKRLKALSLSEIERDIDQSMLNDARKSQSDLVLALAVLEIPGVGSRVVTYTAEYGDNDGNAFIDTFCADVERFHLLKTGETLRRVNLTAFYLPTAETRQ